MAWRTGYTDRVNAILRSGSSAYLSAEARGANGISYFVSGNYGSNGNTGLSWDDPFETLAYALAVSHANIAASSKGWAARNTIFISGDTFVEDLTKGAQKTDIVGVGSDDHRYGAGITGNHVFDSTNYMGMRFFNVNFLTPAGGGVQVTIPTTCSGIGFFGCKFEATAAAPADTAILATASESLSIVGCNFVGRYAVATIDLGTGATNGLIIANNFIESAAIGIRVHASLTCALRQAMIVDNFFNVQTLVIDDNSSKIGIYGNRGSTAAAKEIATVLDCNELTAGDNVFGNATGIGIYPAYAAIT